MRGEYRKEKQTIEDEDRKGMNTEDSISHPFPRTITQSISYTHTHSISHTYTNTHTHSNSFLLTSQNLGIPWSFSPVLFCRVERSAAYRAAFLGIIQIQIGPARIHKKGVNWNERRESNLNE